MRRATIQFQCMSKERLSEQLVVRLEPALRERVETAAAREMRPVANFLRSLIAAHVPAVETEAPRDAA